jgi:hypothetical protein
MRFDFLFLRARLLPILVVLGLSALIALAVIQVLQPRNKLRDFATFVQAGKAYEQGSNPYVRYQEPDPAAGIEPGTSLATGSPNLNPPISIYPFRLLADADPFAARNGLGAVSALIYAGACVLLLKAYPWQRRPLIMLWLLAVAGFWYTLVLGQIYVPLFALGLGALLLIERGRSLLWAGVLAGLVVAIKPNFAIWPLFLLLAGHRKLALTAIAVAAAVSAVPLLLEGPEIYSQWLEAARAYPRAAIAINASMFGLATRLGIPEVGHVVTAGIIAVGAFYAWRWRLTAREASHWAVMLTLFVGPLTWVGYTLFMLPLLLSRRWARWELAIAATMLVPAGLGWPTGEVRLAGIVMLSGLVLNDTLQARRVETEAVAGPSAIRAAA